MGKGKGGKGKGEATKEVPVIKCKCEAIDMECHGLAGALLDRIIYVCKLHKCHRVIMLPKSQINTEKDDQ